jgi:hypothetical protein
MTEDSGSEVRDQFFSAPVILNHGVYRESAMKVQKAAPPGKIIKRLVKDLPPMGSMPAKEKNGSQ